MAVAVGEAQASVLTKVKMLENGRALYAGVISAGTEYPTGGYTLASDPAGRASLPSVIDTILIVGAGGYDFEFVPGATPKIKAYVSAAAAKEPSQEVAAKKDLSAVKAQFLAIGIA